MGERRGIYRVLLGRPEGKRPLGRSRCRWWEDYMKMEFLEVGCGGMDWINLVAGTCVCSNEPSVSIKYGESLD